MPAHALAMQDGIIFVMDDREARSVSFGTLLKNQRIALILDSQAKVKDPSTYRVVGRSSARVDIPAKAVGALTFVHDVRVPGMLHGRVVRPPYAGIDSGAFVGQLLESVDTASAAALPGVKAVVVIGDFIGVVAQREEQAILAAKALVVKWKPLPPLRTMDRPDKAIESAPSTPRLLLEEGDVEAVRQQRIRLPCRAAMRGRTRCTARSGLRVRLRTTSNPAKAALRYGPVLRTRCLCASISPRSLRGTRVTSTSCAWKPPAVTAATVPTTWPGMHCCSHGLARRRYACNCRAPTSISGSPRGLAR